jgi:uncharacterized protein YbaP (TraB family)
MRPIFALFVSLFCLLTASASIASAAERGALFRVSLDGHVMHLFGTLHVGLPEFYPLEPRVVDALSQASTLALEIDPGQPQWELARALRSHGLLAAGSKDYDNMAPARRALLDRLIQQGGLDPSRARTFKPVLLATMLTMAEYTRQGYRTDLSSEAFLARKARSWQVRVMELESLGGQLALFDRLAEADRWRFLEEMMGTIESGVMRDEAGAIVRAWGAADRHALDQIAARCEADASVSGRFVNQVLLKERNIGIADKLMQLLQAEDRTVAAIGVLHLLGTGNVLALLQERGVSVEKMY